MFQKNWQELIKPNKLNIETGDDQRRVATIENAWIANSDVRPGDDVPVIWIANWTEQLSPWMHEILDIVGGGELLATTPWFQRSIEARNPSIDPLNLIQIEFMRRRRGRPAA